MTSDCLCGHPENEHSRVGKRRECFHAVAEGVFCYCLNFSHADDVYIQVPLTPILQALHAYQVARESDAEALEPNNSGNLAGDELAEILRGLLP